MHVVFIVITIGYALGNPIQQSWDTEIIKQINTINDDGSYTFGFESADGTFRVETRDAYGIVKGRYGFYDDQGSLRVLEYFTGNGGFVAFGDHLPIQPYHKEQISSSLRTKENTPSRFLQAERRENYNAQNSSREKILSDELDAAHDQALQSLFEKKIDDEDVLILERQVEKQQRVGIQETPSLNPSDVY
ncbi:uncharacterized protein LOC136028105 isoform X2 [Artemia franciscana]|uniref:Cuticle protein n=1 Tax=Artemia franciscana TaxID=6661 RepID=A0AA88ITC8_ARTSF|nr:hypothetical protein QYM36_007865 [Artemia franciscana]